MRFERMPQHEIFYEQYRSRYGRESVCNHRELSDILQRHDDHDAIVAAMLARVGMSGMGDGNSDAKT
jgi:hypothetical protein